MDLRYSESDEAFRKELREWLADVLPTLPAEPSMDDWAGRREYDTDWQRRLFDAGYAGLAWPRAAPVICVAISGIRVVGISTYCRSTPAYLVPRGSQHRRCGAMCARRWLASSGQGSPGGN